MDNFLKPSTRHQTTNLYAIYQIVGLPSGRPKCLDIWPCYGSREWYLELRLQPNIETPQFSQVETNFYTMEVPTVTSLAEIYPKDALEAQTKRWKDLISTFKETYGRLPDFVSRSPGRVNIIGEVSLCNSQLRHWLSTWQRGNSNRANANIVSAYRLLAI